VTNLLRNDSALAQRVNLDVDSLCSMIHFCLTSCYFVFDDHFFVQNDGVAMGSSLVCVVAGIYMSFFVDMALHQCRLSRVVIPPFFWVRYVDDVLAVFHDRREIQPFLDFINSLRTSIQFTSEVEENGSIPFLDLLISKSDDGLLYSVYRKPTNTERYLHRRSCHPDTTFRSLVSCLKRRALSVCSSSELGRELSGLRTTFTSNGYSRVDIMPLHTSRKRRDEGRSSQTAQRVVLPFYPALAGKLTRIFRRVGLKPCFRPIRSLDSLLCKRKWGSHVSRGLVYRIPCTQCGWSYVGETSRSLSDRLKEHRRAVRNFSSTSELVSHMLSTDHRIDWEGAKVICREPFYNKRIFKEAWFTSKYHSSNRVFHTLDAAWKIVN
jgi:hypothetical protein